MSEMTLGDHVDTCDVCQIPIDDIASAVTHESMGKILTFCSEGCLKQYIEDPGMYAEYDDDVSLE